MNINPLAIVGPWDAGITLDVHTLSSEFLGYDLQGHPQFETVRSEVGEALYRCKYRNDKSACAALADLAAEFIRAKLPKGDVVVPVPPSKVRSFQPLAAIASRSAQRLGLEYDSTSLQKTKETPELKSVAEMAERAKALSDAFQVRGTNLQGKRIILLDDLYRSGASMSAVARALKKQGNVASVSVIALTRTRSNS